MKTEKSKNKISNEGSLLNLCKVKAEKTVVELISKYVQMALSVASFYP